MGIRIDNGGFAKLKENVLSLILIKCTCHLLQLALLHASSKSLRKNFKFLVAKKHMWFSKFSPRQQRYNTLYKALNDNVASLKYLSDSAAR